MQLVLPVVLVCSAWWAAPTPPAPREPTRKAARPASSRAASTPESELTFTHALPGVRVSMGPLWGLSESPVRTFFSIDVTASALMIFSTNRSQSWVSKKLFPGALFLTPELSYSYDTRQVHLAGAGLAVGIRDFLFGIHYLARFVLGSGRFGLAHGIRHGPVVEAGYGTITIEITHQVVWIHRSAQHDIRVLAGLDLVRMIYWIQQVAKRG